MNAHTLISRTSISATIAALSVLAGCQSHTAGSDHEQKTQSGAMHSSRDTAMTTPAAMNKPGSMMADCKEMKDQKQKMAAQMKAQDAELAARIATMNSAPDADQLKLLAAIVTQMAEQRSAMHVEMGKMEEGMRKHMMKHMEAGQDSMSNCPMMAGKTNKSGN